MGIRETEKVNLIDHVLWNYNSKFRKIYYYIIRIVD